MPKMWKQCEQHAQKPNTYVEALHGRRRTVSSVQKEVASDVKYPTLCRVLIKSAKRSPSARKGLY